jgi:hypothetical protein
VKLEELDKIKRGDAILAPHPMYPASQPLVMYRLVGFSSDRRLVCVARGFFGPKLWFPIEAVLGWSKEVRP